MTACNIIRDEHSISIFTDGASYDGSGRLAGVTQKIWPLAHLNAALICRGPHSFMPMLIGQITAMFATFDELVAGIVPLAMLAYAKNEAELSACEIGREFDLFIAGWSEERGRAESYVVASHSTFVESWKLVELGPVALAPFDSAMAEWCELNFDRLQRQESISAIGIAIMEAQRGIDGTNAGNGAEMRGVGAFCQWTVISRDTIMTGIIKRWPDAFGEPLGISDIPLRLRNESVRSGRAAAPSG